MKKPLRILLLVSVAILAAFLVLRSVGLRLWERSLSGPFTGVPYTGSITTAPTSALTIPSHGQLEVHELPSHPNPVVLLRSESGDIQWARLFLPEKSGQMARMSTQDCESYVCGVGSSGAQVSSSSSLATGIGAAKRAA